MKYYKISSKEEADTLSTTMYKMMYPPNASVTTTRLFDWNTNDNGDVIINVPEDIQPVFKKKDYNATITTIEDITGEPTDTATKADIDTGKVDPTDLLNGLEEVDYQYLLDNGFIKINKSPIV